MCVPLGGGEEVTAAMGRLAALTLEDTLTPEAAEDAALLWADTGIQASIR